jgi:hypothetical protein
MALHRRTKRLASQQADFSLNPDRRGKSRHVLLQAERELSGTDRSLVEIFSSRLRANPAAS